MSRAHRLTAILPCNDLDASEAFYCRPADMKELYPEVYQLLGAYYRVDPVKWFPDA